MLIRIGILPSAAEPALSGSIVRQNTFRGHAPIVGAANVAVRVAGASDTQHDIASERSIGDDSYFFVSVVQGAKLGRPRVGYAKEKEIGVALASGKGIRRVATELGLGVSTVQRVKASAAAFDGATP